MYIAYVLLPVFQWHMHEYIEQIREHGDEATYRYPFSKRLPERQYNYVCQCTFHTINTLTLLVVDIYWAVELAV